MSNFCAGSIKIPNSKAANYRSIIALIDDRLNFYKSESGINNFSLIELREGRLYKEYSDLAMMASKVAYENAAYIKEAVTDHWKVSIMTNFTSYIYYI